MAGFLGSIFTKAHRSEADSVARATGGSSVAYGGLGGLGQVGGWDVDKAVASGMEKITWIFRAIDVIATNQARLPMRLLASRSDDKRIVEDSRLDRILNGRANDYELSWQFRYRLSAVLLLSRRGAFIEVVNGRDGRPAQLHILPPGYVEPIPDPYTFVSGYKVQRGDWQVDILPPERVIWIRLKPHPTDPYAQMTPLTAAGLTAETEYYARIYNRQFIANGGKPGLLINVAGNLSQDDAEELRQRFSGGPITAGRTSVVEADHVNVVDLSGKPSDMQWVELLTAAKEEILMAFGVPESIMGNASGRTFDNADAERENFWIDTMVPHCDGIAQSLDSLTGSTTDDTVLAYNYEGIDVLQRMAQRRRAEALGEVNAGLRTVDEYLEIAGREPWNTPETTALWRPGNVPLPRKEEDLEALMRLRPVGTPDPSGGLGALGLGMFGQQAQNANMDTAGAKSIERKSAAETRRANRRARSSGSANDQEGDLDPEHPYMEERLSLEGQIEGILSAWDAQQESVISDRLTHAKFRKGTRHWEEPEEKALGDFVKRRVLRRLNPDYAVEAQRWVRDLEGAMQRLLVRTIRKTALQAAIEMDQDGVLDKIRDTKSRNKLVRLFGLDYERVLEQIYEQSMEVVRTAAQNQSARVRDKIADMDQEGASIRQIEKEIRRLIGRRAPWRKQLAVNVVTSAIEGTRVRAYSEAPGRYQKVWRSRRDERVRPTHVKANGQVRNVGSKFRVGAGFLMAPGDPTGPIGEVVNCRCWVEFRATPKSERIV